MNQSPKAKFLRAKYITREKERQWFWRVIAGLRKCCLSTESQNDEDITESGSPEVSIPHLVEIKHMLEVHGTDGIKQVVDMDSDQVKREMAHIYPEHAVIDTAQIKHTECLEIIVLKEQQETSDDRPWARRRHYYNENRYDELITNNLKEDEGFPFYKPWSFDHLDQGFKPWARRRHYYNQVPYEGRFFRDFGEGERLPTNNSTVVSNSDSRPWARRRHFYNETRHAVQEPCFAEEYKPWARRHHYYNENSRYLTGPDTSQRRPVLNHISSIMSLEDKIHTLNK